MSMSVEKIISIVKGNLGANYTETDDTVLINLVNTIIDECFNVANRMYDTTKILDDFTSIIVQCAVIAYQNRGVEGQTKQNELGQENYFIDWHQYLRDEVVKHGKRYVI